MISLFFTLLSIASFIFFIVAFIGGCMIDEEKDKKDIDDYFNIG